MNKNKIAKVFFSLVFIFSLVMTCTQNAFASTNNYQNQAVNIQAKSSLAIDANSGQILYANNAKSVRPIASMTKLITIYLTLQAINQGKLTWYEKVIPDKDAVKVSQNTDFSNVPLYKNHKYTIQQLYQATLIESANGAAMTLAKAIAGSQMIFVDQMRTQLKKWGINDAKIYTTDGLPNGTSGSQSYPGISKKAENEMSAIDMAKVGQHLLKDYPEVLQTTRIPKKNFVDGSKTTPMNNWNWMLKGLKQASKYEVDGLKTGTTDAAGACFIGTTAMHNRRLITVVMGAKHADGNDPSRFVQTEKLLDFINQNYALYELKKDTIFSGVKQVSVPNGKQTIANLVMKNNSDIWIKHGDNLTATFSKKTLSAPLEKGQTVGQYQLKLNKKSISTINNKELTIPATVKTNVDKANIFVRLWRYIFK